MNVDRFEIKPEGLGEINIDIEPDGEWVKYEDIKHLIAEAKAGQHEAIVIGTPLEIAKYAVSEGLEHEIEEIAMQISRYGYEMEKKGFEEGLKIRE